MKIAVVMPIFNEEKKIGGVLKTLSKIKLPVILVNDGSTDKTLEIIKPLIAKKIILVSHKINLGKGSALKTGTEAAFIKGMDAVIYMDADGQHKASDIKKFVKKLNTNKYDIVFGSRNLNLNVPLIRFLGNKTAAVLISLLFGIYVTDLLCGFRALTKKGYEKIVWKSRGYGVEAEMAVRAAKYKLKSAEVPIETIYHDKHKGVTILDAFGILTDILRWRITL